MPHPRFDAAWARAILAGMALLPMLSACAPRQAHPDPALEAGTARSAILFVGDGMGISTVTAARILEGQLRGEPGEENLLAFERLPHVALIKTYNVDQQVPDSAGTMTAMVTGAKTRAGVLSVDASVPRGDHAAVEGHRLTTLLERAEQRGLSTGVVTTTTITHATPAAAFAHSPERDWEVDAELPPAARAADFPDLARQLVEFDAGDGLEVALGGGRAFFLPTGMREAGDPEATGARLDGRDLTREWVSGRAGAAYVRSQAELDALDLGATNHLLGLFAPSHLAFEAQRVAEARDEPSLARMTAAALEVLTRNPRGFVLVVEGGRIDHGHHVGSAFMALHDTLAFARAVGTALAKVDLEETLVVVTADHDHTLTMGGYAVRGNPILGLVVGSGRQGEPPQPARDLLGRSYTTLGYQNGPGYTGASESQPEGPKQLLHTPTAVRGIREGRPDLEALDVAGARYLQESTVPLKRETHAGHDVPLYAGGPGAWRFDGVREQSYVYHAIVRALGWPQEPVEPDRNARTDRAGGSR
jgi:alkaline phosphatase